MVYAFYFVLIKDTPILRTFREVKKTGRVIESVLSLAHLKKDTFNLWSKPHVDSYERSHEDKGCIRIKRQHSVYRGGHNT